MTSVPPPADTDFRRGHRVRVAQRTAAWFDRYATGRPAWRARNHFYYAEIERLARQTIPPGARVLELGCGVGDLLAAVQPSFGVGLDVSEGMLRQARLRHPQLQFLRADAHEPPVRGTFDYVICSDLLGHLEDIQLVLEVLHRVCTPQTRIVITYWNFAWQVALTAAERLGLKMPQGAQNWLGMADVDNVLLLTDYATLARDTRLLLPRPVPVLGPLFNQWLIRLPFLRLMGLTTHWVVQPQQPPRAEALSCSVIVPCRNEEDNIAACLDRMPDLGTHTEVIFVDGASTDRTRERILEQIERYRGRRDIKLIDQVPDPNGPAPPEIAPFAATTGWRPAESAPGSGVLPSGQSALSIGRPSPTAHVPADGEVRMLRLGKGDAVRKGFAAAGGDVLFILDSDLTVPPEELPKFLTPIATRKAGFVNGTRLVYPMEDEAMMFHRLLGNKFFSVLFTWLLGQTIKDTLCGTKVMRKRDYDRLAANRGYFGDFDPFGDFDLLFGAARLGLRIVEVPVRYRARTSGYSKVRVVEHAPLLFKMSFVGFRRLKLQPWLERLRGNPPALGAPVAPIPRDALPAA
ncbi:MAG: Glycosyltransferase [uncultured Chloroflexi bacterium]|uniref:Glycosyltransferase n=1 Tax=uncultured Chloroflexota bacterium TaxID=166587 RepID=A0A6J4JK60_9CHLR|nr:MAG: Glycosyltransferase [uncultured Chloroflexota bacterium]